MTSLPLLLSVVHLIGLALGLGCATAKLSLLLKCRADQASPAYIQTAKPITRLIILGLGLLTLSGVGWLLIGYWPLPILIAKLVLVAAIWVLVGSSTMSPSRSFGSWPRGLVSQHHPNSCGVSVTT